MGDDNVIVVRDIKKSFKIYSDKGTTLKERIIMTKRNKYRKSEILKGVSFSVKRGEAVGLVGKNGCGKSTTLKMLTRIMYPDEGIIEVKGKTSSLLELGAGFHPDMSGRENIYLNASIFGLTKREIDKKVEDIIRFSELEEYIENPVRTYSSGMYMRLAFSVAINVDADILLIDEILGVGDVSFQKKCFERLQEIKRMGTTIVIVSHSLEQLELICDRCIWIQDGKIREEGIPQIVNAHYYKEMEEQRLERCVRETKNKEHETTDTNESTETVGNGEKKPYNKENEIEEMQVITKSFMDENAIQVGTQECFFADVMIRNLKDSNEIIYSINDSMEICLKLRAIRNMENVNVSVSITREDGVYCYGTNTTFDNMPRIDVIFDKEYNLKFIFESIKLLPGKYFLNVGVYNDVNKEYDVIWNAKKFYIKADNYNKEIGVFQMQHKWIYLS